jgi:hypothetical protein
MNTNNEDTKNPDFLTISLVSILVLLSCIAVVLLIINKFSDPEVVTETATKTVEQETCYESRCLVEAAVLCEMLVERSLVAPSTAKFPANGTRDTKSAGNGIYITNSYVDAQNSFGAMIRNNYYCKLQFANNDWTVIDLQINP